jgi:hypothetical protein
MVWQYIWCLMLLAGIPHHQSLYNGNLLLLPFLTASKSIDRAASDVAAMHRSLLGDVAALWEISFKFLRVWEICHFGGLGGPRALGCHSVWWGAKPPTFWKGILGPRAHRDTQNDRFQVLKQILIY